MYICMRTRPLNIDSSNIKLFKRATNNNENQKTNNKVLIIKY